MKISVGGHHRLPRRPIHWSRLLDNNETPHVILVANATAQLTSQTKGVSNPMKSMKCPKCGFVGWADAEACKRCGTAIAPRSVPQPAPQAVEQPVEQFVDQPVEQSVEQPVEGSVYQPVEQSPVQEGSEQPDEYRTYYYPVGTNPFPEELKTGWAITSLVIGIANFLFLGITLISILVGIIVSVVALKKIKRDPFKYGGKGLAVAGLVTNLVSVVVLVPILIIAAIAIPNLLASRRAANEGAAINSLRTIHTAQETYQSTRGAGFYGTLSDLERESLIKPQLATGVYAGYSFKVEPVNERGDQGPGFTIVAVPIQYGSTGRRSFYLDETGVIRGGDIKGAEPDKYDAPLNFNSEYSSARSRRATSQDDY